MLPAILAATRECIPKAVKEIDNEKVEAALKALRKQKSQEGHDARLDADEFRLVMNLISSKADSMVWTRAGCFSGGIEKGACGRTYYSRHRPISDCLRE